MAEQPRRFDLKAFFDGLTAETDRAAVVLGSDLLADMLRIALSAGFTLIRTKRLLDSGVGSATLPAALRWSVGFKVSIQPTKRPVPGVYRLFLGEHNFEVRHWSGRCRASPYGKVLPP
jgi:hypothetical protein